jgi:DNA-directed RNA polymerase subunit beta'
MAQGGNDFNAIRISLASPEQIRLWSYGEVTKPETINYRTLRPEKDGLFCERIFGPTKDWECYCGKYKKIRHRGIICDRCGVEIARAKVRRERMGHIHLAAPVAHIWFSKGTPSRLGLMLDLSPKNLDRVLYFAQYLITNVDQELVADEVDRLQNGLDAELDRMETKCLEDSEAIQAQIDAADENDLSEEQFDALKEQLRALNEKYDNERDELETEIQEQIDDMEGLAVGGLLTESRFRDLRDSCGDVFEAGMGAEAVLELLRGIDLDDMRDALQEEIRTTSGQRHKKAVKRLRVVEAFRKSENKPDWMIFTELPVLPPELRPMVQLDGGRFATSDLNDLYRRVINRNNRLKRLIDLMAPEIIVRNEKRMLQEAVDALVDNGRRGRAVAGSHNHKLKSLSDLLRGKQGRFRQNLLGKRVDYSGRSVIIVGPELKLNECGLPRKMALELFKPFVMNKLVINGYAHNIKSAKRLAESERPEVWDILERVVQDRPVLLNRAPTLHRLGIQAFQPVLIEGSAIRLHPLVTTAFNADFDGDQMAVHVPLSKEAVWEAKRMMLSTNNMLAPSSGEPIVSPTLDMVLGCFYMTQALEGARGEGREFADIEDARLAYELGLVDLRAPVKVRSENDDAWMETTPGRIVFNDALPEEMRDYYGVVIDRDKLNEITSRAHQILGNEDTAEVLDNIKDMGFHYASKSGVTIAINDVEVPTQKQGIIVKAESKIAELDEMYMDGFVTENDRYNDTVRIWTEANDDLTKAVEDNLSEYGGGKRETMKNAGIGLYMMATSGAKGNIAQIKQMAGMRGLMSDPHGRIIERPIKSSFREGLSVLEYFLSTHGARKGLTDTALRTADSGYMTRRLIDVAQELIILEEDCGTLEGMLIETKRPDSILPPFEDRAKSRYAAEAVADPNTGEIMVERNDLLSMEMLTKIVEAGVSQVMVRSPIRCEAERGLCRMCYGLSLATWRPIMIGEAVGIIAAQSIGEPGTQLTMRTFHTGGIAGSDITSGLPRVNELFEARVPKGEAVLSEIDGAVTVNETTDGRIVEVVNTETYTDEYVLPEGSSLIVGDGDLVNIGDTLAALEVDEESEETALMPNDILARVSGMVHVEGDTLSISWTDEDKREYQIPAASALIVNSGDKVVAGDPLTAGPKSPQRILSLQGRESVQQYLIDEVQNVYRSQGVTIHDKHIEVIISQMLRKVKVEDSGDTNLLPDDDIDRKQFEEINASVLAEGGEPATASPVLLGITRASLKMDSFLSAASFQETTRVLTEAAVNSEVDYLRGLKENVIIGRLIPARLDLTEEGRTFLDIPEDEEEIDPISMLTGPADEFESEMSQGPFGLGIESQPEDLMAANGMSAEEFVEERAPVGDD